MRTVAFGSEALNSSGEALAEYYQTLTGWQPILDSSAGFGRVFASFCNISPISRLAKWPSTCTAPLCRRAGNSRVLVQYSGNSGKGQGAHGEKAPTASAPSAAASHRVADMARLEPFVAAIVSSR